MTNVLNTLKKIFRTILLLIGSNLFMWNRTDQNKNKRGYKGSIRRRVIDQTVLLYFHPSISLPVLFVLAMPCQHHQIFQNQHHEPDELSQKQFPGLSFQSKISDGSSAERLRTRPSRTSGPFPDGRNILLHGVPVPRCGLKTQRHNNS